MNLLFSRSQMRASSFSLIPLRIGGTVTFRLKAELELSDEELALAQKYSFTKATLIRSSPAEDLSNAYRSAIFLSMFIVISIIIFVPVSTFGRGYDAIISKVLAVLGLGFVSFVILTILYFVKLRNHVSVNHLTNGGRTFYCHSVVELDQQEVKILDICKRFYFTLEKAKNWGGREINPLPDGQPFYLNDPGGGERRGAIDGAMHQAGQTAAKFMKPFRTSTQHEEGSEAPRTFFQKVGGVLHDEEAPQTRRTPPPATPPSYPAQPPQQPSHQPPPATQAPPVQRPVSPPPPAPTPSTPPSSPLQGKPHPLAPKPPGDEPSGF